MITPSSGVTDPSATIRIDVSRAITDLEARRHPRITPKRRAQLKLEGASWATCANSNRGNRAGQGDKQENGCVAAKSAPQLLPRG